MGFSVFRQRIPKYTKILVIIEKVVPYLLSFVKETGMNLRVFLLYSRPSSTTLEARGEG